MRTTPVTKHSTRKNKQETIPELVASPNAVEDKQPSELPKTADLCGLTQDDLQNLANGLEALAATSQTKVRAGATLFPLMLKIEQAVQVFIKK